MTVADLEGMVIGPKPLRITRERVMSYVEITGDDPQRWGRFAPPGLASAALFAVAPELFAHPAVMAEGGAAVHGEQTFFWKAPLRLEEAWAVRGEVKRVGYRRGVWFVDFALTVADSEGAVLVEGNSSFLIAGGQPPARSQAPEPEPAAHHRAENQPAWPGALPAVGEDCPPLAKSASRADLIRYAAVTRDWNPIHWDHQSALRAGLPGVVVHGLACSAWMCQGITRLVAGSAPLRKARFRYRKPLRPGISAQVLGMRSSTDRFTMRLESGGEVLIAATMETPSA